MPPKTKDKGKGAPGANYKTGKPVKDILPANAKAPREGAPIRAEGEPEPLRNYAFETLPMFPNWPGNDEAKNSDFT